VPGRVVNDAVGPDEVEVECQLLVAGVGRGQLRDLGLDFVQAQGSRYASIVVRVDVPVHRLAEVERLKIWSSDSHIQDVDAENQKLREEAFSRAPGWYRQIGYGVQASHPDQENHQEQAPTAWHPQHQCVRRPKRLPHDAVGRLISHQTKELLCLE